MRLWQSLAIAALMLAPAFAALPASGQETSLPERAPSPKMRPPQAGSADPAGAAPPLPEPRPAEAAPVAGEDADGPARADAKDEAGGQVPADPRSQAVRKLFMPPAEIVCRQRLRDSGAVFADVPAPAPQDGCALPYPIALRGLPGDVAVEPEAVLNCAMAEAVAEFARDQMSAAASASLDQPVAGIGQASGYVCRPRNGSAKLSEHAFGNALDIASFRMADGRTITVAPDLEGWARIFVDRLRAEACGPFKTVLGPGSDADHANHLHLDLAPRRSKTPICE
jgi:hypothetical protein